MLDVLRDHGGGLVDDGPVARVNAVHPLEVLQPLER
jgi:hypothetical protein